MIANLISRCAKGYDPTYVHWLWFSFQWHKDNQPFSKFGVPEGMPACVAKIGWKGYSVVIGSFSDPVKTTCPHCRDVRDGNADR